MQIENIDNTPWQVHKLKELIHQNQSIYFDVDDFEEIVEFFILEGNYKESLKIAEYACKVHPASIPLMLKKAQLLASLNKEHFALDLLSEVETLEPSNSDVFLTRGAIYSQMQKYEKAIEEYNKAVQDSEEPDFVYCNIAFEYENMGNYDKTIEYLSKALEVNPENDMAMYEAAYCFDLLSLTEESISFFKKLVDRNPFSVEAWYNLGVSFQQANLHEKAIEAFEYALAIEPEHGSTLFYMAYTYSSMGRYYDAIRTYKYTLEGEEADSVTFYHIGECYEKMEEYTEAKKYYKKTTDINPDFVDAWIGAGICERELGNAGPALDAVHRALDKDPENTAYLNILADMYLLYDELEKAGYYYEKAMESSPEDEALRLDYADGLIEKEQLEEAAEVVHEGIEKLGSLSSLYYKMAAILFMQGRNKDASFFLTEALLLNYDNHGPMLEQHPSLKDNPHVIELLNHYGD